MANASLDLSCGPLDQLKHALDTLAVKLAPTSGLGKLGEIIAWPLEKTKFKRLMSLYWHCRKNNCELRSYSTNLFFEQYTSDTARKMQADTALQLEDLKGAIGDLKMRAALQKEGEIP